MKKSTIIVSSILGIGCLGMTCVASVGVYIFYRGAQVIQELANSGTFTPVAEMELQTEDYSEARKSFQTNLLVKAASPQLAPPSIQIPPGIEIIPYSSGELKLSAYVDSAPANGEKRPAVLFLHGGFAFGDDDLQMPQPYRDAGYVVMVPVLRGENGQPGNFSYYYDEVEDVLGAAEALAALPYVDAEKIYLAGHSAGGVLTQLTAMTSNKFVAAASFSGNCNAQNFTDHTLMRFDTTDLQEYLVRSPVAYATSFKCPVRLYYGNEEFWIVAQTLETVTRAKGAGINIESESVAGDHMTAVPESIQRSINFFKSLEKKPE